MTSLNARAEAMRARLRVRAWETRQLRGAKGTWFRLRSMLARTREAYVVDDATIEVLIAEGFVEEGVGNELEPNRSYVFIPSERASSISSRRPIVVRLSAELLSSKNLILVAF